MRLATLPKHQYHISQTFWSLPFHCVNICHQKTTCCSSVYFEQRMYFLLPLFTRDNVQIRKQGNMRISCHSTTVAWTGRVPYHYIFMGVHLISLKTNFTDIVNKLYKQMHCLWCQSPNWTHTKKIFLALQSCVQVSKCKMCEAKVAVGSSHVHLVLQIFSKCQILVIVAHCLSEVPQTVMCVTQKVACLWLTLNIMQLLLDTQKCPSCNTWTLGAGVKTILFRVSWCQCFVVQSSYIQICTSSWYNQSINQTINPAVKICPHLIPKTEKQCKTTFSFNALQYLKEQCFVEGS